MAAPPIVWTPSEERIASAAITRYREWLNETRSLSLESYHDLWQWSVDELEDFWASIWDYFEVDASRPYERVLTRREMPGAEWFPGAQLSYAEHIFRHRDDTEVAIHHASELRPLAEWTWGELRARAGAVSAALREAGVVAGDRVAAYLPNIPETIAAFLGCASIGATWSSCAPEFGVRSVVDRFAQIEPKVLLSVDGYRYGGKDFDRSDAIAALQQELPTLEQTFVLPYLAGERPPVLAPGLDLRAERARLQLAAVDRQRRDAADEGRADVGPARGGVEPDVLAEPFAHPVEALRRERRACRADALEA